MRFLAHPPLGARLATRIEAGRTARDRVQVEALLGSDHELARVLRAVQTTVKQTLAVAALVGLSGALALVGDGDAIAVVLVGTLVEGALSCRLAVLRVNRRDSCRELIIAGRDRLPLAVLERETRRLQSRSCREQLARLLEAIPATAGQRYGCAVGSLVSRGVVSAVAPLLREVASGLRSDDCSVRAVALIERLVTGPSPLYDTDADRLRRELGRIRASLSERPAR